jgi:hypothetical protein
MIVNGGSVTGPKPLIDLCSVLLFKVIMSTSAFLSGLGNAFNRASRCEKMEKAADGKRRRRQPR